MTSSSGMRRFLEDRVIVCADCDTTRTLSVSSSGNLVCSTCGSDNWMYLPTMATISQSILIKGELRADEDLTVEGSVEGKIDLGDHNLWISSHGNVRAGVRARNVIIAGTLIGRITASERVEIKLSASVEGSIKCPRVVIVDGARFNGLVSTDMSRALITTSLISSKTQSAKMG